MAETGFQMLCPLRKEWVLCFIQEEKCWGLLMTFRKIIVLSTSSTLFTAELLIDLC